MEWVSHSCGGWHGQTEQKQYLVEKSGYCLSACFSLSSDPSKTTDTRFVDYREEGKGMIAARVEVYRDDKMVFTEDYTDIKIGVKLDPGAFDPKQFNTTHWEK